MLIYLILVLSAAALSASMPLAQTNPGQGNSYLLDVRLMLFKVPTYQEYKLEMFLGKDAGRIHCMFWWDLGTSGLNSRVSLT